MLTFDVDKIVCYKILAKTPSSGQNKQIEIGPEWPLDEHSWDKKKIWSLDYQGPLIFAS